MGRSLTRSASRRLGLTVPLGGRALSEQAGLLARIADYGYTDLWSQETDAHDALTPLAFAAACAPELQVGSAIASVFTRGPALLAAQAAAMADLAPGRFVLGIGTSSRPIVEGWNGLAFERPLARMRDSLRFLRAAFQGERVAGAFETVRSRGFRLERPPRVIPPVYVAALGVRMLELAAQEADGVILSLVGSEDVPRIRRVLEAASPRPGALPVVLRIGVVADPDPEVARSHCRRLIAGYLTVDRYAALHRWLGRGDVLAPVLQAWGAGDRAAALAAVPDSLVDALFLHGDAATIRAGVSRFRAAGVDLPILSIMRFRGDLVATVRALGEA